MKEIYAELPLTAVTGCKSYRVFLSRLSPGTIYKNSNKNPKHYMTLHKRLLSDYKLFTLPAEDGHFCFYAHKLSPSPEQGAATLRLHSALSEIKHTW